MKISFKNGPSILMPDEPPTNTGQASTHDFILTDATRYRFHMSAYGLLISGLITRKQYRKRRQRARARLNRIRKEVLCPNANSA